MPAVGEKVYVSTLQRSGVATVDRVRRDGRLAVVYSDGTRSRVRADQVRRSVDRRPGVVPAPIDRTPPPPLASRATPAPMGTPQPKPVPVRDRAYLDWLRGQPCVACGFPHGCDPSHHGAHGMGTKADDDRAVSMCRRCHDHWERGAPRRVFAREHLDDDATDEWLRDQARRLRAVFMKEREDG